MKTKKTIAILTILLLLLSMSLSTVAAQQEMPRVRAVLFYSPSCGHCAKVIQEDLPPLLDKYTDQLLIIGVDVSTQDGSELWGAVMEHVGYPLEQAGVPFLLIGDHVMIGSGQIPDELPGLIENALAGEGIPWPDIPILLDFLREQSFIDIDGLDITPTPAAENPAAGTLEHATATFTPETENTPAPTATEAPLPTEDAPTQEPDHGLILLEEADPESIFARFGQRFNRDPLANSIAVTVLLFLIGVVVFIAVQFMRAAELKQWPDWVLPVLLIIGIGIASYMASTEVSGQEAFCGPLGDCNAVQQSEFATLFGFLPVAIFGLIGNIAIGITWWVGQKTTGQAAFYAKLGMFLLALFGLIFFIYLTFLEPFVIGATCAWCISSAIIMALINLIALPIVLDAWARLDLEDEEIK